MIRNFHDNVGHKTACHILKATNTVESTSSSSCRSRDNEGEGKINIEDDIVELSDDDEDDDDDEDKYDDAIQVVAEGSLRLKVRQHVNPLSSRYQVPLELDNNWRSDAYKAPFNNYIVDIGCAKGTWALKAAQSNKNINILGLEIRRPVVEFALKRKVKWNLNNVHFLSCNANVDLENILSSITRPQKTSNSSKIDMVCLQFPDPHFKKKHKKRRVVNSELVETIARHLEYGAQVFLQSDILDVEEDMIENFSSSPYFTVDSAYKLNNLETNINPTKIETEREIATFNKKLPVYRFLFRRNELIAK